MKRNPPTERAPRWRQVVRAKLFSSHLSTFRHSDRTLDLGCGWGYSLIVNPRFWLVDGDVDCISHLKQVSDRAFLCDVAARLPFDDNFFDNVFSNDVLEHLTKEEMDHVFAEVRRILRKGGLFVNAVPNWRGYQLGVERDVGHKRFVTETEIRDSAQASGFQIERVFKSPFSTAWSERFAHNKFVAICRLIA